MRCHCWAPYLACSPDKGHKEACRLHDQQHLSVYSCEDQISAQPYNIYGLGPSLLLLENLKMTPNIFSYI